MVTHTGPGQADDPDGEDGHLQLTTLEGCVVSSPKYTRPQTSCPRSDFGGVREVRVGAAPGQDAAYRVRAARCPAPTGSWRRETRDVRFPGLHAHVRVDEEG